MNQNQSENKTTKQKTFCEEYIVDFNGTRAVIASGYSESGARQAASRLLSNVNIREYISKLIKARELRTQVKQDRVLLEIARLAFNDPRKVFNKETNDLLPVNEWPDELAAAISSIKVTQVNAGDDSNYTVKEVKFWDKGRQLELAAKHLGMFDKSGQDDDTLPESYTVVIERKDARINKTLPSHE